MINKKQMIIMLVICLLPLIAGVILYPQIPDKIAIHWGVNGEPNGWSSKFIAIIVFPLTLTVLTLFMPKLLEMDPSNKNMNEKLKNSIMWILPIITFLCSSLTLLSALGKEVKIEIIIPMTIGLMLAIMGNYLPKAKQSYTVGIKLPWTLNDEENWNKTHRLGGFLFALGGIAIAISSIFECRFVVMLISIFVMVFVPVIYSYLLYKNKQK